MSAKNSTRRQLNKIDFAIRIENTYKQNNSNTGM